MTEEAVKKGLVIFGVILLVIAVWGLYTSLNRLIEIWAGYRYAPAFKVIVNLAMILFGLYIIFKMKES